MRVVTEEQLLKEQIEQMNIFIEKQRVEMEILYLKNELTNLEFKLYKLNNNDNDEWKF